MMLSGYFCCFYLGNVMSIFSIAEGFSFLKHIFVFKVADIFQLVRDYYTLLLLFLPKYIYTIPRAAPGAFDDPVNPLVTLLLLLLPSHPLYLVTSHAQSIQSIS